MIPLLNHTEDTVIISLALVIAAYVIGYQIKKAIKAIENRNRDELIQELVTSSHLCSRCEEER